MGQTKRVKFGQNRFQDKNNCIRKRTLYYDKMANPSRCWITMRLTA